MTSFQFNVDDSPDAYRRDIPTPAEYQPAWCSRCKRFHFPDPLWYNKFVDAAAKQLADLIDADILVELGQ